MAPRIKFPEVTTPIGTLKWPKLHEPDYGTDDYPNPGGSFNTKLVLKKDDPATQAFLKEVEPHYQAALAAGKEQFASLSVQSRKKVGEAKPRPFWQPIYDEETEEETGDIEISARMKHTIEIKKGPKAGTEFHKWPHIVDSHGNPMNPVPPIGGGSEGRLRVQLVPYFVAAEATMGLSLRLVGVQITELVVDGERTASSMGFDEVEGYTYNPADVPEKDYGGDQLLEGAGSIVEGLNELAHDFADDVQEAFGGRGAKTEEELAKDTQLHDELFGDGTKTPE